MSEASLRIKEMVPTEFAAQSRIRLEGSVSMIVSLHTVLLLNPYIYHSLAVLAQRM